MKQIQIKTKALFIAITFLGLSFLTVSEALASQVNPGKVIELVNVSRKEKGLEELNENPVLTRIAKDKVADMIKNNYFAHTSPEGKTPWHWFEKNNYDYHFAGENLAIDFLTAEDQHRAWMKSPTHKKNILSEKYEEIGVAVLAGEINGKMSLIVAQEFGTLMDSTLTSKSEKEFNAKEDKKNSEKEKALVGPAVLSIKDFNDPTNFNKSNRNLIIGKNPNDSARTIKQVGKEKSILFESIYKALAGMTIFIFILFPFLFIGKVLEANQLSQESDSANRISKDESYLLAMQEWNERNAKFHSR